MISILSDTNAKLIDQTLQLIHNSDFLFIDAFSENLAQVTKVYQDCNIPIPGLNKEWFHMTIPEAQELLTKTKSKKAYTVHMSRHLSQQADLVAKYQTESFIIGYDNLVIEIP